MRVYYLSNIAADRNSSKEFNNYYYSDYLPSKSTNSYKLPNYSHFYSKQITIITTSTTTIQIVTTNTTTAVYKTTFGHNNHSLIVTKDCFILCLSHNFHLQSSYLHHFFTNIYSNC